MTVAHTLPMGVEPRTPVDPIEKALAFHTQAAERLADARLLERIARVLTRSSERSWIVTTAEAGTQAAATTMDAASMELAETIRDYVKEQIMAAVAAMPELSTPTRGL